MSEDNPASKIHVVLVEPEIHWNTGNVGRTCLATGARLHLVQPLGFSLADREVRRAGLDYWPRVRPRLWDSWPELEAALPDLGLPIFFSPGGRKTLWEANMSPPTVLVFGSETRGLPRQILRDYEQRVVSIPQRTGSVRSLNLSTAVAVALYECLRQVGEAAQR